MYDFEELTVGSYRYIIFRFDCPCGNELIEGIEMKRWFKTEAEVNASILETRIELEAHIRGDGL